MSKDNILKCWSARVMQTLLGYSKWENFEKVIQKAKEACKNAGEEVEHHFPDVRKTIPMPTANVIKLRKNIKKGYSI
jgi:hypothetical protein